VLRSVLGETFRLLGRHLDLFTLIVLTVWLPGSVLTNYLEFFDPADGSPGRGVRAGLMIEALFGPLVAGATVVALAGIKRGEPVDYWVAMRGGLGIWPRLFLVRLVAGLITLAGLLALVVPGIVLLVRYALIDAVTVLEGGTAAGIRRRSTALTAGQGWEILALGAGLMAGLIAFGLFLSLLVEVLPGLRHFVTGVLRDCVIAVSQTTVSIAFFLVYWRTARPAAVGRDAQA
jgi:hypothetical protein